MSRLSRPSTSTPATSLPHANRASDIAKTFMLNIDKTIENMIGSMSVSPNTPVCFTDAFGNGWFKTLFEKYSSEKIDLKRFSRKMRRKIGKDKINWAYDVHAYLYANKEKEHNEIFLRSRIRSKPYYARDWETLSNYQNLEKEYNHALRYCFSKIEMLQNMLRAYYENVIHPAVSEFLKGLQAMNEEYITSRTQLLGSILSVVAFIPLGNLVGNVIKDALQPSLTSVDHTYTDDANVSHEVRTSNNAYASQLATDEALFLPNKIIADAHAMTTAHLSKFTLNNTANISLLTCHIKDRLYRMLSALDKVKEKIIQTMKPLPDVKSLGRIDFETYDEKRILLQNLYNAFKSLDKDNQAIIKTYRNARREAELAKVFESYMWAKYITGFSIDDQNWHSFVKVKRGIRKAVGVVISPLRFCGWLVECITGRGSLGSVRNSTFVEKVFWDKAYACQTTKIIESSKLVKTSNNAMINRLKSLRVIDTISRIQYGFSNTVKPLSQPDTYLYGKKRYNLNQHLNGKNYKMSDDTSRSQFVNDRRLAFSHHLTHQNPSQVHLQAGLVGARSLTDSQANMIDRWAILMVETMEHHGNSTVNQLLA